MSDLTIAEIFLLVGIVAVSLITVVIIIAIVNLIIFLRTLKNFIKAAQKTTEVITEDLHTFGNEIIKKGFSLKKLFSFFKKLRSRKK